MVCICVFGKVAEVLKSCLFGFFFFDCLGFGFVSYVLLLLCWIAFGGVLVLLLGVCSVFFVVGFFFVSSCVFCLFVLEFFLLFGLFLFCFVCLLEWSRWCSCFVQFVLFMFAFYFWLFLSVSYENHWFHCNSSAFVVYKKSISAYHFKSWFLLFVFVLLVVCFFLCCLFRITILFFVLHRVSLLLF